jgi:Leucine-rich repeat (LRR) protein
MKKKMTIIVRDSEGKIIENSLIIDYFCNNCNLTEIISIPDKLRELYCYNNKLTSLPKLPKYLKTLSCENNNIEKLPNLIEFENLTKVWCDICCFESYMLEMKDTHFNFYC